MRRLKPASDEDYLVQPHRCHQAFRRGKLSFFFLFPFNWDTYCVLALLSAKANWCVPDNHRQSPAPASFTPNVLHFPEMGLLSLLSADEGRKLCPIPPLQPPLWMCTSAAANSTSTTNQFSSLRQKKTNLTKSTVFSRVSDLNWLIRFYKQSTLQPM